MKFQKLDSKQMPQVIVLGVLCAGALTWGGYNLVTGLSPSKAAAAPPDRKTPVETTTVEPVSAQDTDVQVAQAAAGAGGLLPGNYFNPDPFRPAIKLDRTVKAAPPKPAAAPAPVGPEPNDPWGGPTLPVPGRGAGGLGPQEPEQPAEPPAPERPQLNVTGIIDVDRGPDMALAEIGAETRILQVGDKIGNDYRVKRIGLDGVLLVHSQDRYFVALGNNAETGAGAVRSRR
jgi:hypothetical protein